MKLLYVILYIFYVYLVSKLHILAKSHLILYIQCCHHLGCHWRNFYTLLSISIYTASPKLFIVFSLLKHCFRKGKQTKKQCFDVCCNFFFTVKIPLSGLRSDYVQYKTFYTHCSIDLQSFWIIFQFPSKVGIFALLMLGKKISNFLASDNCSF